MSTKAKRLCSKTVKEDSGKEVYWEPLAAGDDGNNSAFELLSTHTSVEIPQFRAVGHQWKKAGQVQERKPINLAGEAMGNSPATKLEDWTVTKEPLCGDEDIISSPRCLAIPRPKTW